MTEGSNQLPLVCPYHPMKVSAAFNDAIEYDFQKGRGHSGFQLDVTVANRHGQKVSYAIVSSFDGSAINRSGSKTFFSLSMK